MRKKKIIVGLVGVICLLALVAAFRLQPRTLPLKSVGQEGKVAVVFVEGIIVGTRSQAGFFDGGASAHSIMEQLREAREDPAVRAVVLRINSPGGSAAASQEIGDEISKLKKAGKVVVASMGEVAASGGYWIAALADKIVANPATMTGSIGVIMQLENLSELYEKLGIDFNVIKSGPHKDMGSSTRDLTPEEKDILQEMVNDIYEQFIKVVVKGRNLSREKVEALADGRIFTGKQAKQLGLVDQLGNYYDAIDLAAKLAGIEGEPVVVQYDRPSPWQILFGTRRTKSWLREDFLWLLPVLTQWYRLDRSGNLLGGEKIE
ncbi:signal peptide peptidase SppA [Calderihabitans maritimus]|uniref:Signal peptide peptidase SppA, 36K type n=1 Tax=Calderihabitans maritimus TaxID=1246530 RepID=A0A1Z5HWI8_9FIRM|nr:signal peptide peptidase SppA [Calderihabitans maritimus]GAW93778.1 signal peptide peptidase SppA, 36K type [Calderihabitans maritimus]